MNPDSDKPIVALIYDFDKTLSTKDMQEFAFIPSIKMKVKEFWDKSNNLAKNKMMDKNLAYMYTMLTESERSGTCLKREELKSMGKEVEFYTGVTEWFTNIDELAKENDVIVEHYIISSGLKEMIEGTPIFNYFKEVFACEYMYDENGNAVWPKNVVNYTTKTQFLFRINKGSLDLSDDSTVNKFENHRDRRIPFEHFIYFGDGDTDIPCMKLVHMNGGHSIAIYANDKMKEKAKELYTDHRATFFEYADYSKDGEIFKIVSDVMKKICAEDRLYQRSEGYGLERRDISK